MKESEYNLVTRRLLDKAKHIADAKRPGYTIGSEDVLANFKRVGEASGMSTAQCNLVYLLKHLDSIKAYILNPDLHQAEPILERYADLINYVLLNFCIIVEDRDLLDEMLGRTPVEVDQDE